MTSAVSNLAELPLWRRVLKFCLGFEPMRHAWWETLIFRIVIAQVTWESSAGASRFHSQPAPHGLAAWGLDFSWVGSEELARLFAMFYTSIGDGKEGVLSFLEKRDPQFKGHASAMPPFYPWWDRT